VNQTTTNRNIIITRLLPFIECERALYTAALFLTNKFPKVTLHIRA
jgi:hypothetical protein